MDWAENVASITREGWTSKHNRNLVVLGPPAEITYIRPCKFCRSKIVLDSRGRCKNCGAPEELAAEPMPLLFLPKQRPPKATQGGRR